MVAGALESLPSELLQVICQCLNRDDLISVARVSSQCRKAVEPILFKVFRLKISGRSQLSLDMDFCPSKLNRFLDSIHDVEIEGYMPNSAEDGDVHREQPELLHFFPRTYETASQFPSESYRNKGCSRGYEHPHCAFEEDGAWRPLAEFLRRLPSLNSVVYKCSNLFSPCLLEVLHKSHPKCRLHIGTFSFHSIFHDLHVLHSYEYTLASSPCLVSLAAHFACFIKGDKEDYDEEACQWMVSQLAPNLEEFVVLPASRGPCSEKQIGRSKGSPEMIARQRAKRRELKLCRRARPWAGFDVIQESSTPKPSQTHGKLLCLEILYEGSHSLSHLQHWNSATQFAVLQILHINYGLDNEHLRWLLEAERFPSLHTLSLVSTPSSTLASIQHSEHCNLLCSFINALPPLRHLTLGVDQYDEYFEWLVPSILACHGSTLRQLRFNEYRSTRSYGRQLSDQGMHFNVLELIHKRCPNLHELSIKIARPGNKNLAYKTIGKLASLRHLEITLGLPLPSILQGRHSDEHAEAANSAEQPEPVVSSVVSRFLERPYSTDQASRSSVIRNRDVRDAIVNSTIDERLAETIFRLVQDSKSESSKPLESLHVRAGGRVDFLWQSSRLQTLVPGLPEILAAVRGSWQVVRNPRDDRRDEIVVTRLHDDPEREQQDRPSIIHESLKPILRDIWPEMSESFGEWHQELYSKR